MLAQNHLEEVLNVLLRFTYESGNDDDEGTVDEW